MNTPSLADLERRLRMHVDVLAGDIGERNVARPQALHTAAQYIRTQWQALGYDVSVQEYLIDGIACSNLQADPVAAERPDGIHVVGAHYDSARGTPGADDNASGVAALIELSRAFAGCAGARAPRFVAFVNEEQPYHGTAQMGSAVYARAARARGDAVRLMVALEMLGFYDPRAGTQAYPPGLKWFYPDTADFIACVSDFGSRLELRRFARALRGTCTVPVEHLAAFRWVPGVSWSDHAAFWNAGYPAIMVTDTAFYRNPHYHTANDTPDTLDFGRLARVTDALHTALLDLLHRSPKRGRSDF
ncbi:MAG: M28 family peptidase [Gammaproteobacteria bacterium]